MHKRILQLFSFLLVVAFCCTGCMIMSGESQSTTVPEYTEPSEALPEETEPAYRLMVITGTTLNIRSGPGEDCDIVGKLQEGDQVQVLEESNGWGRIEQGWISLMYAEDYSSEETPTQATTPTQPHTPTQPTTPPEPSTQDMSHLLQGNWYYYEIYESDCYWVYSKEFYNNKVTDKSFWYYPDTGTNYQLGEHEGTYTYDGQYVTIDAPPYSYNDKYIIELSGNTMHWVDSGILWHRLSWEELTAQINQEHATSR